MTDNATYAQGNLPSSGIPFVIVNGNVVVDDSEVLRDVNPGQPIRFEPVESRFEPLDRDAWMTGSETKKELYIHFVDASLNYKMVTVN